MKVRLIRPECAQNIFHTKLSPPFIRSVTAVQPEMFHTTLDKHLYVKFIEMVVH